MSISVGEAMPSGQLKTMVDGRPHTVKTHEFFAGRRVVLFGVPAAFSPGCSRNHVPQYVDNADEIRAQGFDEIACIAANDVWVMHAWGEALNATGRVLMLADGSARYAQALGLDQDLSAHDMGIRFRRFSMVVNDGVVESINIDGHLIETTTAAHTCGL